MRALGLTILSLLTTIYSFAQLPDNATTVCPRLVGESVPELVLNNTLGKPVKTKALFKKQPTVLIFYRGGWCPYCNRHLADIGKAEDEIIKLGLQIVAVSPDALDKLTATAGEDDVKYTLLSDGDGSFAKAMGIAYKAPEKQKKRLLDYSGGVNSDYLPVPSVFILNTKGEIVFEYVNPDYKTRMSKELLLSILKNLDLE